MALVKELLTYAVQRQIACGCGRILDSRKNAVLVDGTDHVQPDGVKGGMVLLCSDCYDTKVPGILAQNPGMQVEITDARDKPQTVSDALMNGLLG